MLKKLLKNVSPVVCIALAVHAPLTAAKVASSFPLSDSISSRALSPPGDASTLLTRVVSWNQDRLQDDRRLFQTAEHLLQTRQRSRFEHLQEELRDYPLYPYLRHQDLQSRLNTATREELTQFLDEFASSPPASQLRQFLLLRYANQRRWDEFLAFYQPQDEARLQCYYARALIETGRPEESIVLLPSLWLTGKAQPSNCDWVFREWRDNGALTTELAWQRVELAMNDEHQGIAGTLRQTLKGEWRGWLDTWLKLHRRPEALLQADNLPPEPLAQKITMNVVAQYANREPARAAALWERLQERYTFTEQQQATVARNIALTMALRHEDGAEDWFARAGASHLDTVALEWRIRNCIRQGTWDTALIAIQDLEARGKLASQWIYWRAYAMEQTGQSQTARDLYLIVAQERNFYGFLAADRLQLPYAVDDRPYQISAGDVYDISLTPGIARAQELLQLDRQVEARREWHAAVKTLTQEQRIYAAKLAQLWGWHGRSVLTMASTDNRDDLELRFPLPYQEAVIAHSDRSQIDAAWTYGIIRRESAFITDARSPKGALGLMQLLPTTAKNISRSLKVHLTNTYQLLQAETNIKLGTGHLSKIYREFGGKAVLATAAYNAGERRVMEWLPTGAPMDAIRWVETIPYGETREYVRIVMAYTVIYRHRMGQAPQRLTDALTDIPPRNQLITLAAN